MDIAKLRANATTLRHEEYIKYDEALMQVAQNSLPMVSDLIEKGLFDDSFTIGDTISKFEKVSAMTAADISMDAATKSEKDRVKFVEVGIPIPTYQKGFQLNARQIESSRKRGASLPTVQIEAASRVVSESLDDMVINGVPSITFGGFQVYGYTNFPDRNTYTITNAWNGGSATPVQDILDMIQLALDANFSGPYYVYVSKDRWTLLQDDYSTAKGDRTLMERILAIPSVEAVKMAPGLAANEVLLIQMTKDVVDLAVAQTMINYEEPQTLQMIHDFNVFACMAVRIKSDINGNCGVVHATGA